MRVEVYASHTHVAEKDLRGKNCVVIDTFRASSTIITALSNGAAQVIPLEEVEQAMDLRASMGDVQALLGGERDGQRIPGFDMGNSPLEYVQEKVYGKTLIFTTTNGTQAIRMAQLGARAYVAGMINARRVAKELLGLKEDVVLLCAGMEGKFAMEDAMTVGYMIKCLRYRNTTVPLELDDLGVVCELFYEKTRGHQQEMLQLSCGYQILQSLDCQEDVSYCMEPDTVPVLPMVQDDRIILKKGRDKH